MQLTKYAHAAVKLSKDEGSVVIDPAYVDPSILDGITDVFITHEHEDHLSIDVLTARAAKGGLTLWTNAATADKVQGIEGLTVNVVGNGDSFTASGFKIDVVGELHEILHPDIPQITNIGFVLDGKAFHPGDAFTVPTTKIETILIPINAPWSKSSEVVDWVREIGATEGYPVHDAMLSDAGHGFMEMFLGPNGPGTPTRYIPVNPGDEVHVH